MEAQICGDAGVIPSESLLNQLSLVVPEKNRKNNRGLRSALPGNRQSFSNKFSVYSFGLGHGFCHASMAPVPIARITTPYTLEKNP